MNQATETKSQEQPPPDRMMKFFGYGHLPEGNIRNTSKQFGMMAMWVESQIAPGPERTVALRKLVEAKDAAVRAVVFPKG